MDEFTAKAESETSGQNDRLENKLKQVEVRSSLARSFDADFRRNEVLRRDKEDEWAKSLRQLKGIYDPDVVIQGNRSKVYVKYTRAKFVPCVAKLNSMLFGRDKNWSIESTPEPKLTDEQMKTILTGLISSSANTGKEPSASDFIKAITDFAKASCESMSRTMEDQLVASGHTKEQKKQIRSGVLYGSGVMKGPLTRTITRREIEGTGEDMKYVEKDETRPIGNSVNIWRFYPDMSATEPEDMDHAFELHCMTKHQLRGLGRREDFDGDIINQHIKSNPEGDYKLRQWEIDIQSIADENVKKNPLKRYEVLEMWGFVDGQDLKDAGVEGLKESDYERSIYVNAWILGKQIIKIALAPTPSDPVTGEPMPAYHIFNYEKDENSVLGTGLPKTIRDMAIAICAAVRMMIDNGAAASGPIIEVFTELFPGEDVTDIYPMRMFKREGSRGADMQYPGIRTYNIESHIPEYMQMINTFKSLGDDESTMPALQNAEATGNQTAEGISTVMSNTNVTLGDIVANFDESNESYLKALYAWNLEFNPKPEIHGDYQVKAVGTKSLLTKELRARSIDNFKATLSPADEPYVKRRNLLYESMVARDLNPENDLYTEEEAQQNIERMKDAEAAALMKAKMAAEIEYDQAKALNMRTKAGAIADKTKLDTASLVKDIADSEEESRRADESEGKKGK